jgi:hypothetical protein
VWNRIAEDKCDQVIDLALAEPELSPAQGA